jgi:hypothetical protein
MNAIPLTSFCFKLFQNFARIVIYTNYATLDVHVYVCFQNTKKNDLLQVNKYDLSNQ